MKSTEYNRLIESFREWLQALNYEKNTIKYAPNRISEFFEWLEVQQISTISDITDELVKTFIKSLEHRRSKRTGKALSINYMRAYQRELRRFSRYLNETGQGHIEVSMQIAAPDKTNLQKEIFTKAEIEQLYKTCGDDYLGIRDRAMLSVYYGCGLRRNEGANLELKDVQFNSSMIYVRKGKNYKERFVPMVGRVKKDLLDYVKYGRPGLENGNTGNTLFISYRGESLFGSAMAERFIRLKKESGITKKGNLHTLRHSIATHLLSEGMSLEQIARFLGHSSLESTQIYTHIVNEKI